MAVAAGSREAPRLVYAARMSLLLAMVLSAAPHSCPELWTPVYESWAAREQRSERTPLFKQVPDAKDKLGKAWIAECGRLDAATLDCARRVTLEKELKAIAERLAKERMPRPEIDHLLEKLRKEWDILSCVEVDRALDRAAAVVAKEAGLETKPSRRPDGGL